MLNRLSLLQLEEPESGDRGRASFVPSSESILKLYSFKPSQASVKLFCAFSNCSTGESRDWIDSLGGRMDCSFRGRVSESEIDLIGVCVKGQISGALEGHFLSPAISRDSSVVDDPLLLVW